MGRKPQNKLRRALRRRLRTTIGLFFIVLVGGVALLREHTGAKNIGEFLFFVEEHLPELLGAVIKWVVIVVGGYLFVRSFLWRFLLRRYVFGWGRLTEVPPPRRIFEEPVSSSQDGPVPPSEPERIATLQEHRDALYAVLRSAKRDVVIVSPSISVRAIKHDALHKEIRRAVARGVRVRVFTDTLLDVERETQTVREAAQEGRMELVRAGAELYVTDRIHNKSLTKDTDEIVEGSFNWLSAVRTENSRHQKHEVSWRFWGPGAVTKIADLKAELQARATAHLCFFSGKGGG